MNNEQRFPKELLKEGDPDNYLARAIRKLEKMRQKTRQKS